MSRINKLRAAAQRLYEEAARITHADERLAVIFRAMELETQADGLEQQGAPAPMDQQHAVHQQQHPQPDEHEE